MKVLFAVNDEKISESIIKRYQKDYKEIISAKNVYYYNAIIKELQKDKSYDRIIIGEDLEPFSSDDYSSIDRFIFDKLDKISDEAYNTVGNDIPIILICTDRRTRPEPLLIKLFGISVYNALIGKDRSIDEVCRLIKKPRSKKEAKSYYRIDSEKVEYKPENESDVSEAEIQNILAHYKRLGKDSEKYVTSFDSIAEQYNDEQLKLIINFLPKNVINVLEESSSNYRQLIGLDPKITKKQKRINTNVEKKRIEMLDKELNKPKLSSPVIIPGTVDTQKVKKVIQRKTEETNNDMKVKNAEMQNQIVPERQKQVQTVDSILEEIEKPVKRGRGRPPKNKQEILEEIEKPVKRGRGRPPKDKKSDDSIDSLLEIKEENNNSKRSVKKESQNFKDEDILSGYDDDDNALPGYDDDEDVLPEYDDVLPGYDDDEDTLPGYDDEILSDDDEDENTLPGYDDEIVVDEDENTLPGYDDEIVVDDDDDENTLPGYDDEIVVDDDEDENTLPGYDDEMVVDDDEDENTLPGYDDEDENTLPGYDDEIASDEDEDDYYEDKSSNIPIQNVNFNNNGSKNINNSIQNRSYSSSQLNVNIDNLLTSDKKIVSFVGTSKNGTSFLINNLAKILSEKGIKTAILDLTQNRNAYYVYTDNREDLRNIAYKSIENLNRGVAGGIEINKNLTVYTSLPDEMDITKNSQNIIKTLLNNYSLILLDCDFLTDYSYFNIAQEIYLVQSLDVLTIQPLTAFLRELKARNILDQNKLRIVINKFVKSPITIKMLIGGISSYNDPSMSYMTELFNKDLIKYITIPFEIQNYSVYLGCLVDCKINLRGYSKNLLKSLDELGNMVFPLLGTAQGQSSYNKYNNNFSKNTNNTLNKMKNKF